MLRKGLKVAVLTACVFGVSASMTPATAGSLGDILIGSPLDPVTNPPGPRPPPKLESVPGTDNGPPGPKPPPKLDGGPKGVTPPPK